MPAKATKRTASETGNDLRKRAEEKLVRRPGRGAASGTTTSRRHGLFTVKFKAKPVLQVDPEIINDQQVSELFADAHAAYLRYCKLAKVQPRKVNVSRSQPEQLRGMYEHLAQLVKAKQPKARVSIYHDKQGSEFQFLVTRYYKFDYELFVFPLEFLHWLKVNESPLYIPMCRFCGWMLHRMDFSNWNNAGWADCCAESILDRADEHADDDPALALEMIADARRYERDGIADKYLEAIDAFKTCKPTAIHKREVDRLKLPSELQFLQGWLKLGIDLMTSKDCVPVPNMQFDDEFLNEHDEDYDRDDSQPIQLDDQFIILWHNEDSYTSDYMAVIDSLNGEYGSHQPMEWMFITKNTRSPYMPNNWPNDWRQWFDQGIVSMDAYCKKNRLLHKDENE